MMLAAAALLLTLSSPTFVCTEVSDGSGSCYGMLGSVEHFTSRSWGGDVFLATYQDKSFHCTAGDSNSEFFSRAAAAPGMVAISWDKYHRCISVDIFKQQPRPGATASADSFVFKL
jgi:hypothetical protein